MSYEILESLINVGYNGKLIDENAFSEAISEGFKNEDFRLLVSFLSHEIHELGKLEEKITDVSDISSFLIELSSFLKELQCSYDILVSGNINSRMQTVESRFTLLEFLVSELMTQKMLYVIQKPKKEKANVLTIHESSTAAALKDIAITLNLGKPPDNISADALFNKINSRLDETIKNIPDGQKRIGLPLFNPKNSLKSEHWSKIDKIYAMLDEEYNMRRKMLMTRLDVTVQSFKWSERIKGKEHEINEKYGSKQQRLEKIINEDHRTDIVALLAARNTLAIIEKTSSANVRKNTKSKLQRHIIGKVPDRGGRTLEHQKPPPEMPSWQKRQPDRGGFNQNRGGGGGRGGFQQNQNQGYPPQQYQQKAPHNPSNQQYSGNSYNQQQHYQDNNQGYNSRGGGRVQGGWNQRGQSYNNDNNYNNQQRDNYQQNYRGGRGRR